MTDVHIASKAPLVAAQIVGRHHVMDDAAQRGLRIARRIAAPHVRTGNYISHLRVENVPGLSGNGQLVRDRLIVADDPNAFDIEYGHFNERSQTFVPGQHILTRTRAAM